MEPVYHITLFSKMAVLRNGKPLALRERKSMELLAYLAFHLNEDQQREELVGMFWPEAERAKGLDSLRYALAYLRKKLEKSAPPDEELTGKIILADNQSVTLSSEYVTTDVARYKMLLEQGERTAANSECAGLLRQATGLYGKGLLPVWYDEWAQGERERLRQAQRQALIQLSGLLRDRDENEAAIAYARQAIVLDAEHEPAHECLMRAQLQAGQTASALQQYKRVEAMLAESVGVSPSPSLQGLAQQARAQQAQGANGRQNSLRPTNLPHPQTHFFDRADDIANLRSLLRFDRKLVTLTATGGVGKTRLALETARKLLAEFDGRAYWVELAGLTDAGNLLEAAAETVLLQRHAHIATLEQLAQEAGRNRVLLVLDNFEHLVETGADVVKELLERLPMWRLLVTSRQALRLQGEQVYAVPLLPLTVGMELFADRAKLVNADFTLDAVNISLVTVLCERLEGIPLAIELAAAWSDMLTPVGIAHRLPQRFDLLVSRYRNTPARHHSLYAMIEWSYAQLSPSLQQLFARLSVFRGGWFGEAAQAICVAEREATTVSAFPTDVLFGLQELQARSLIGAEPVGEDTRYTMLETLREFAHAQLTEAERTEAADCHADYFLNLTETANPLTGASGSNFWLDKLDSDRENLNAALDWLRARKRTGAQLELAVALVWFWHSRGHVSEGRQHLTRALADYTKDSVLRVDGLRGAGVLANYQDDIIASTRLFTESLCLARQLDYAGGIAWNLYALGHDHLARSEFAQAWRSLEESLPLFEQLADQTGIASALHKMGSVLLAQGEYQEAGEYFQRSANLHQSLGNRQKEAISRLNIGNVQINQGNMAAAKQAFETSLAMLEAEKDEWTAAVVQTALGALAYHASGLDEAGEWLQRAQATNQRQGARVSEAWTQYHLGNLAMRRGQHKPAREHYAAGITTLNALEQHRRVAVLLTAFACLSEATGLWKRSARLFGAFDACCVRLNVNMAPFERAEYEPALAATRAALDEATFAACWAEGQAYTPEQAIAYALQDNTDQA